MNWFACVCVFVLPCTRDASLNGGHRSVKIHLQKLLSAADRWPTRPWIACLTFSGGVPTSVSDCSGTPQESHLLTDRSNQWRWFLFIFSLLLLWHGPKEVVLTFEAGAWIDATSQAIWLSKTHKRWALLLWLEDWLILRTANVMKVCQFPFFSLFRQKMR